MRILNCADLDLAGMSDSDSAHSHVIIGEVLQHLMGRQILGEVSLDRLVGTQAQGEAALRKQQSARPAD